MKLTSFVYVSFSLGSRLSVSHTQRPALERFISVLMKLITGQLAWIMRTFQRVEFIYTLMSKSSDTFAYIS